MVYDFDVGISLFIIPCHIFLFLVLSLLFLRFICVYGNVCFDFYNGKISLSYWINFDFFFFFLIYMDEFISVTITNMIDWILIFDIEVFLFTISYRRFLFLFLFPSFLRFVYIRSIYMILKRFKNIFYRHYHKKIRFSWDD